MRLFVAVWPPPPVVGQLRALPRPDVSGVRWVPPEQWHVTLAFLGEVAPDRAEGLVRSLSGVDPGEPVTAALGPALSLLGSGVLSVPVAGVDRLAGVVAATTRPSLLPLRPDEGRSFRGHLTVARSKGRRRMLRSLAGAPIAASWPVTEIDLVSSIRDLDGTRYETVGRRELPR